VTTSVTKVSFMQSAINHQSVFYCASVMLLRKVQIDETQIQQRCMGSMDDTVWDHHAKETDHNKMWEKEKLRFRRWRLMVLLCLSTPMLKWFSAT